MHGVVLSVLVALAAGSCLPDAIPPASRQNLVNPNGETYPVGLLLAGWEASHVAHYLGSVLIQEVLGYNTRLSLQQLVRTSSDAYYGLMGCRNYSISWDRGCLGGVTYYHINFDSWSNHASMWEFIQRNYTSIAPINKGNMGYRGFEGMFIPKAVQERAHSQGLAFKSYLNWNASVEPPPWDFFDSIETIDKSKLRPCNDYGVYLPSAFEQYADITGDVDGVVILNDGVYGPRCDDAYFWLSPKCRSNPSNCVPWITRGAAWGMDAAMHKFTAFDMPVAIGVAATEDDHTQLALAGNMSFYSWSGDPTLLELTPVRVEFPPHNASQFGDVSIDTLVSHDLAALAPTVEKFAGNVNLSIAQMNEILLDQKRTSDSWEDVICRWVTSNRATWQQWIPDASECFPGFGLYDTVVEGFVEQRERAMNRITCEACPLGTFSQMMEDSMGQSHICTPCKPGEYQDGLRSAECKRCALGTYQDEEGQMACKSCPTNTNTGQLGSIAPSNCSESDAAAPETTEGGTTVGTPTVVEVTLTLTVDDAAEITGNAVVQFAMITSFAATMGVNASQVSLTFQVSRRLDSARRLQTTLLAIFSVRTASAAAAEQTRASIEAVSLAQTSAAISTAAAGAGYTGSLVVFDKVAVAVRQETSSGCATMQMAAMGLMLLLRI